MCCRIQTSCVTMRPVAEVEDGGQLLGFGLVMQKRSCLKYPAQRQGPGLY